MMELGLWLTYLGVITTLIAMPGPFSLLCLANGAKHGVLNTLVTIIGGTLGSLLLLTISAIGLGAIIIASETLFLVIRILGAIYLIYLGLCAWRDAKKIKRSAVQTHHTQSNHELLSAKNKNSCQKEDAPSALHLFKLGFLVSISNPKDILFFIALFPHFIRLDQPELPQFAILAITWVCVDLPLMLIYAASGSRLTKIFANKTYMQIFNQTISIFFIIIASTLIIDAVFNF